MTAGALDLFTSLFIIMIHRSIFSEPVLVMLVGFIIYLIELEAFHIKDPHALMDSFTWITLLVLFFRRLPVFFLLKKFLKGYTIKDIMVMD